MGNVNVTDPVTGEAHSVPEADAEASGWAPQTEAQGTRQAMNTAVQEHFTSTSQKVLAGLEGAASGATLGLSDLLEGDDAADRAKYNPGWRMGGELIGAIAPALGTLGGDEGGVLKAIADLTPAGQVAKRGEQVRAALGGVGGAIAAGGLEGAAFGAGGTLTKAKLSGDPLTVESLAAGAGTGLLLGVGAGILGGSLEHASIRAEEGLAAERAAAVMEKDSPSLQALGDQVSAISKSARETVQSARQAMRDSTAAIKKMDKEFDAGRALEDIRSSHNQFIGEARLAGADLEGIPMRLQRAYGTASRAIAGESDFTKLRGALEEYSNAVRGASAETGVPVTRELPVLETEIRRSTAEAGQKAADTLHQLAQLPVLLKAAPSTPAQLAAMGDERFLAFQGGLKSILNSQLPELGSASTQLKNTLEAVVQEHGLKVPIGAGDATDGLAAVRQALRKSRETAAAHGVEKATNSGFIGWAKKTARLYAGRQGSKFGRGLGGPLGSAMGYEAGALSTSAALGMGRRYPVSRAGLVADVLGLRTAISRSTRGILASAGRPIGEGFLRVSPVAAKLAVSYTGNKDQEKDIRQLAMNRAKEAIGMSSTGAHRDALYAAVQPIATHSLELAQALVHHVAGALDYVASMAPKDPGGGGALVNGKWDRGWMPSRNQAEEFAAVHEAFIAPMDSIQRLVSGNFEPAAADALWAMYPTVMAKMQADAVALLSSKNAPSLNMSQRSGLSLALRLPLDGLLRPEAISALQTAYVNDDPQPKQGGGQPPGPSSGRPASSEMTKVQQLQDHAV